MKKIEVVLPEPVAFNFGMPPVRVMHAATENAITFLQRSEPAERSNAGCIFASKYGRDSDFPHKSRDEEN